MRCLHFWVSWLLTKVTLNLLGRFLLSMFKIVAWTILSLQQVGRKLGKQARISTGASTPTVHMFKGKTGKPATLLQCRTSLTIHSDNSGFDKCLDLIIGSIGFF